MSKKDKIYREVMSSISYSGKTNVHLKLQGGLCGVVKEVINVEVWESEDAVTFVTENNSKITYHTDLIDLYCVMSD